MILLQSRTLIQERASMVSSFPFFSRINSLISQKKKKGFSVNCIGGLIGEIDIHSQGSYNISSVFVDSIVVGNSPVGSVVGGIY